jgi:HlyD family secretion protein
MKRISLFSILGLLLLLACSDRNGPPRGSGLIEASEVTFSVETSGQLRALNYDEGARVEAGDTLAVIDTATVMLRLRQARAAAEAARTQVEMAAIGVRQSESNLEQANTEFERLATLIRTGSANQQQYDRGKTAFDQAKLAREQAEASRRAAEAQLTNALAQADLLKDQANDHFPISPTGGVVVERFIEPGELVAVGKPLLRIARLDTVWVKIYLPPSDLARLTIGGHALVDPEAGNKKAFDGIISWISSEAEFTPKNVQTREARAGLLYAVKVTIPNADQILKIGMPVSVVVE